MRALLVTLLLLVGLASARADEPANLPQADRDAIAAVVGQQLEAFKRDDAAAAYGFASPGIQHMFGDAANFMAMVQHSFAPVYRPRSVHMGEVVMRDGLLVQRVELVGPDGRDELALYTMEKQPDGTWRIDGCQLTKPDTVGT
jgi:ketosteroid isomerase-like protein